MKTENRGKLTTVEISGLPKHIFVKGEKILNPSYIKGNQIFSDDLISTNLEIKQGKLDFNFAESKMWVYDLRKHEPYENSVRKSNKELSPNRLLSGSPIIVRSDPYWS